ncbi:BSP-domain-containing protein [Annulohypoxylon truncatum]|uniref:BSP-domain-containing protein n=1 Tax=Annulohypoxylon truncatum TaxID=327061 RepID=UPI002007D135|nr:BSP-domain-containing protein [Annulohypoxylon truncatum]KAI1214114.1 BSP-domain-containing protein [Annulohypoxylon truncatum]
MSQSDPSNILSSTEDIHIHLTISQGEDQDRKSTHSPMAIPPETTPVPPSVFTPGMSLRTDEPKPTPAPTPSAIPVRPKDEPAPTQTENEEEEQKPFEIPRLRLHIEDLSHPGSAIFLSSVQAPAVLKSSIESIHKHLYGIPIPSSHPPTATPTTTTTTPSSSSLPQTSNSHRHQTHPPKPRSITLLLRPIEGVAYTTGTDLDPAHKEIHFSLRYITSVTPPTPSRRVSEYTGVLLHELVHCYQWNASGSAPGGLIEGVADWVRLRCGLAPPHWKRDDVPRRWDVGYQGTAYFLEYLEARFGEGTVRRLNEKLRKERYEEKAFWTELVGRPVEQLFEDYKETLPKKGEGGGREVGLDSLIDR